MYDKNPGQMLRDYLSRASVLARNPGELAAFLEKARFIDSEHGSGIAKLLNHIGTQIIA